MFYTDGKWKLSELECYEQRIRCPRCLASLYPFDSTVFKCEDCDFEAATAEVVNLPARIQASLAVASSYEIDAESLKDVVDSLEDRGEVEAARELSAIVSGITVDHGTVVDAKTVAAIQILASVEDSLLCDEKVRHFAPRIAMLRHKIEKEARNA
jgi:hypothetical protein